MCVYGTLCRQIKARYDRAARRISGYRQPFEPFWNQKSPAYRFFARNRQPKIASQCLFSLPPLPGLRFIGAPRSGVPHFRTPLCGAYTTYTWHEANSIHESSLTMSDLPPKLGFQAITAPAGGDPGIFNFGAAGGRPDIVKEI